MPWYKTGTVSVVQNSNAVIGTGTSFIANSRVGDAFRGPDGGWYEVVNIASDTALSISPNYQGVTNAAGGYALAPLQGYVKESADALRALVNQFGSILAVFGDTATTAGVREALGLVDTDGMPEGAANQYFTAARSRATTLTGLVLTESSAVVSTDSILVAIGKVQAQFDGRAVKGENNDITALFGLTTALSIDQGGTGAKTPTQARASLGAAGGKNVFINANFSVNQRRYVSGTATTVANQYTLDRLRVNVSGQSVAITPNGNGNQITAPAGGVEQIIEGINIEPGVYSLTWTGTATATVNGAAISNGGQTAALPAGVNVSIKFFGGTVKEVQFELGAIATAYEPKTAVQILMECQRYAEVVDAVYFSYGAAGTLIGGGIPYKVAKRATPTVVRIGGGTLATYTNAGGLSQGGNTETLSCYRDASVSGAVAFHDRFLSTAEL